MKHFEQRRDVVQLTLSRAALVAVVRKDWGEVRPGSRETRQKPTAIVQVNNDGGWEQGPAVQVGKRGQILDIFRR